MRLRDGLNELAAALYTLSISLDAVVFRDTWRAVAIAAMRLLYNEIATEAQFSPEVSSYPAVPPFIGLYLNSQSIQILPGPAFTSSQARTTLD